MGTEETRIETLVENVAWVQRLAAKLLSDPVLAEDVSQEVLAVALERAPKPRNRAHIRAWLFTVTRNLSFRALRRRADRSHGEREAAREEAVQGIGERVDLQRRLAAAVLALPEQQRALLVMRYFDGLAPVEIARRMGLPGPTVRKRLSRALARLQVTMRTELSEDGGDWRARLALLTAPSPSAQAWPLVLGGVGLVVAASWAAWGSGPGLASWTLNDHLGRPVAGMRVLDVGGRGTRSVGTTDQDGRWEARSRGPFVFDRENWVPVVIDPGADEGTSLALPRRGFLSGSAYFLGQPPTLPLALTLAVDLRSLRAPPEVPLDPQWFPIESGRLLLSTETRDRGRFDFGGLPAGTPVVVGLPSGLDFGFVSRGEVVGPGLLSLEADAEVLMFDVEPRER